MSAAVQLPAPEEVWPLCARLLGRACSCALRDQACFFLALGLAAVRQAGGDDEGLVRLERRRTAFNRQHGANVALHQALAARWWRP